MLPLLPTWTPQPQGSSIIMVDVIWKNCKILPEEKYLGKPKDNRGDKTKDMGEI